MRLEITVLLDALLILLVLRLHRAETVVDLDVLATLTSHLVAHVRGVALAELHQRLKITVLLDALLLLLVLRLHRAETVVDLDVLATLVSHLVAHVRSVALAKLHQRLKITVLLDALLL